ncbi:hypothetical protein CEY16_12850 [Halalkalibacillus sediminis]|uniref:Uncharacterized protein n=1 Tax=Halalkalibacillus sediminis TaxID=2018042 RepID=A0A2I0QQV1_9BACI|nr:hypothetical protein [Halalkalibacillus sediminis]PKR76701.1 hypothetical protein CEY16_12850 [Halalkalibacillus sediminis]
MKKLFIILGVLGVIVFTALAWYLYPKDVSKQVTAFEYTAGSNQPEVDKEIEVLIEGTLRKKLFDGPTFNGFIGIEGIKIPGGKKDQKMTISFSEDGTGILTYGFYENNKPKTHSIGRIIMEGDFDIFTILMGNWNYNSGESIAAPAGNREEAKKVTEKLVNKVWE